MLNKYIWLISCISLFFSCGYTPGIRAQNSDGKINKSETADSDLPDITGTEGLTLTYTKILGMDKKGNYIKEYSFKDNGKELTVTVIPYVKLKGKIVVVGNEPFTMVMLKTSEDSYYINGDEGDAYRDRQTKDVTIEARVEKRKINNTKTKRKLSRNILYPIKS
ncbi:MAG: hypothetical protein JXK07_07150 [Spirochaetes bacterium]|nr:hypothetical protein [Spirochaetota bacterium]MBN2769630.1 hypothetical protein [Spirochaetota bacterium]